MHMAATAQLQLKSTPPSDDISGRSYGGTASVNACGSMSDLGWNGQYVLELR